MAESEVNERLLRNVKKEVKQLMEESVTRKFVHEESSTVTALCSAVEVCLQHGLRKRALGLFKNSNTTTALLQKVAKTFEPAAAIVRSLADLEKNMENAKKLGDSTSMANLRRFNTKYLWIKLSLFEKQLARIVEHLVDNCSKYYEKDALISDPVDGMILSSLLVGPCALEYTRMKTPDHYWTDPPADELVQRHRIHSSGNHYIPARSDSPKRPALQLHKTTSSSSEDAVQRQSSTTAKEYVESLHQNAKSTLLYGKNNVIVQPKENIEPLAGYLSLHQTADSLALKWTPNQLMNGGGSEDDETSIDRRKSASRKVLYWDYALTIYLDEIVYLHCHQQPSSGGTVVLVGQDGVQRPPIHFPKGGHLLAFLSCLENGLLPRGQLDPPLWSHRVKGKPFPKLKPKFGPVALFSSFMNSVVEEVTSSVSPASSSPAMSVVSGDDSSVAGGGDGGEGGSGTAGGAGVGDEETEASDYVFRIIYMQRPENIAEMIDPKSRGQVDEGRTGTMAAGSGPFEWMSVAPTREVTVQPTNNDVFQSYARSLVDRATGNGTAGSGGGVLVFNSRLSTMAVKQLCDAMKWQILSRAFYGWLSHCRHMKTVRTHLSGLVHSQVVSVDSPVSAVGGLTVDWWQQATQTGQVSQEAELYRLVYYGGCDPLIRKEVWPYLLGFYAMDSTIESRRDHDLATRQRYERLMSEWLAVETIARQRDRDLTASSTTTVAPKLSSGESQDGGINVEITKLPFFRKDSSLSNDVFESMEAVCTGGTGIDDVSRPETVVEESSNVTTPTTDQSLPATETTSANTDSRDVIRTVLRGGVLITSSTAAECGSSVADRCDSSNLSPDDGLGSSIAAPRNSSRSTDSSRRVDSYDTDHGDELVAPSRDGSTVADRTDEQAANRLEPAHSGSDSKPSENTTRDTGAEAADEANMAAGQVSTANSLYSAELLDAVALNIHRIDKDVHRCDRNNAYFTTTNLEKLRNIMCTYVWENLEVGYIQGMCDLLAPLLVIFDDEVKTFGCFCRLMKRMSANFPQGGAMDQHFGNMRSLIQILDPELFEHMRQNGDYTHFYFSYRWFLLDFKRELVYDDVFTVWETIWVARHVSSPHFVLFIALALVEYYREIIIDNGMDFTDIIKFFNEMAERHSAKEVLQIARGLVHRLQDLIENK